MPGREIYNGVIYLMLVYSGVSMFWQDICFIKSVIVEYRINN